MGESVENEWLCSKILQAYGLPVARTQILQFEDMKVLAVKRFDRRWWENEEGKKWLLRLPQEDMCQATGTPPRCAQRTRTGSCGTSCVALAECRNRTWRRGSGRPRADAVLDNIVAQTPEVVRSVRALLPENFPEHVAESILNGLHTGRSRHIGRLAIVLPLEQLYKMNRFFWCNLLSWHILLDHALGARVISFFLVLV